MISIADFNLIRAGLRGLAFVVLLAAGGALYAQPDMLVTHTGNAILDGDDYDFTPIKGATLPMGFVIENNGTTDLNIGLLVLSSNPQNCTVSFQSMPSAVIAPGNSSSFAVTLSTPDSGNYSFNVTINNDDPDSNPYNFTVEGTVLGGGGSKSSGGGGGGGCAATETGNAPKLVLVLALLAEALFLIRIGMFRRD